MGVQEARCEDGSVRVHEVRTGLGQTGQDIETLGGHEPLGQLPPVPEGSEIQFSDRKGIDGGVGGNFDFGT